MVARPVPFFVGSGRSGTTLVRAMVDSHPEIAIPPESYFIFTFARHRRRYERAGHFDTQRYLADLLAHRQFLNWGLDAHGVREQLSAMEPRSYPDAVRATYQLYSRAHNKPRYGDKTPIYVMAMPLLARLFPEARFVHIIRDGRDVALSWLDQPFGPDTIDTAATAWRLRVQRGRRAGRRLGPGRYYEMRYEALVAEPEAVLRGLCEFIELDFDPAMLRYFDRSRDIVPNAGPAGSHDNLSRPVTKGLRDWRRDMSAADAARFEALAGDLLARLGYFTTDTTRAGGLSARFRRTVGEAQDYMRWLRAELGLRAGPRPRPSPE